MGLLDFLKPDPRKRLQAELQRTSTQAMQLQRSGKLRESATLTARVEELQQELDALDARSGDGN